MAKLRAKLAKREKIAESTYALTIEPAGVAPFSYRAGQTLDVTVPGPAMDPAGNRRTFSIANAPGYGGFLIATRVRGSGMKHALVEAPIGTDLEVEGPFGNFTLPSKPAQAFFLAGGIGVTPFRAMVEDTLERSLDHTLSLIHSNRSPEEAPFLDELMRWGIQSAREMADPAIGRGSRERRGGHGRREALESRPPDVDYLPGGPLLDPALSGAGPMDAPAGSIDPVGLTETGYPSDTRGASTLVASRRPHFVYLPTMTQPRRSSRPWKGEARRVTPEFLADILPTRRNDPLYYVAGPPRWVIGAVGALKGAGVDEDRIRFEEFPGY